MGPVKCLQALIKREAIGTILRAALKVLRCALQAGRTIRAARVSIGIRAGRARVEKVLVCALSPGIARGERVTALLVLAGKLVIAGLQALIALRRCLLGSVVAEEIKNTDDSLLLNWRPQPGCCFEGEDLIVRRCGR
jgi:hypothetical protein